MSEAQEVEKEKVSVKEILELIEGLKVAAPAGIEIAADGKLSAKDIKVVVETIKKHDVLVAAVKDIDKVIPEAKDIDQAELAQIGLAVLPLFKLCQEAYARGK